MNNLGCIYTRIAQLEMPQKSEKFDKAFEHLEQAIDISREISAANMGYTIVDNETQ